MKPNPDDAPFNNWSEAKQQAYLKRAASQLRQRPEPTKAEMDARIHELKASCKAAHPGGWNPQKRNTP